MHDHRLITFRVISTGLHDFVLGRTRLGALRTCWSHLGAFSTTDDAIEDETLEPELTTALTAYFQGDPARLPLTVIPSHPPFFSRCWEACAAIPRGSWISYKALATSVGSPLACRAAGQAMKTNPLPVLVPCHRVKATGGEGGYAGSTDADSRALETKRFLMNLEMDPTDAPPRARGLPT